ncbi:hypothetical protein [Paraburkholderia fungorum]|uniref:hypothetical protein n=1 Tax=Paraburkholderia fungorum TaxID=134537 RepID=UPI0015FF0ED7|nr:hypothetical protein [Paraburkholderia fungorum]
MFQLPAHDENVIIMNLADASVSRVGKAMLKLLNSIKLGKSPYGDYFSPTSIAAPR